jgi:predicted  nucleic acid-binding Zn-ribbon protein
MPLIVIHNHIHFNVLEKLIALEAKIDNLLNITTMSQEILDQLTAKVNAVTTSLANIKDDITRIKDSLPTSGGLTEAEVADLSAKLDAAVSQADTLDKENEPA